MFKIVNEATEIIIIENGARNDLAMSHYYFTSHGRINESLKSPGKKAAQFSLKNLYWWRIHKLSRQTLWVLNYAYRRRFS